MIKPDLSVTIPDSLGNVHFVGMGGSGMSGIARLFLASGLTVSGSDRTDSKYLRALADAGATVSIGHDAANVGDADTIVVTSALWPDNPEYVYAQQNGLTILHRSQALAWLANRHRLIAVAGAHGKTTSTGMVVTALRELGADPSFVNGGVIQNYGTSSDLGSGELFVLEADESDGSFLIYDPAVAIITNIDTDHLDHYGSEAAIAEAFATFARGARELVVVSSDDAAATAVGDSLRETGSVRVLTFGTAEHADVRVVFDDGAADPDSGPNTFDLRWYDKDFAVTLEVPGKHNAINAAGAFAALVGLGFEPELVAAAVARFGGTGRRFELHDVVGGVSVYDDYAHHPTEVAAALSAARTVVGEGRIVAVHQPHLYSRTQRMAGEFAEVLEAHADLTVVLDVCGAREDPVPGVTGALVSERFADSGKVSYQPEWSGAAAYLGEVARPGDFVITLGCGDVNLLIPQILESLGKRSGSQAIGA